MERFKTYNEKEIFVQNVFSRIAKHYDVMNRVLSFNMDSYWRRFTISKLCLAPQSKVLDIACGTCMMIIEAHRQQPTANFFGLDFNANMLKLGERNLGKHGLTDKVTLVQGDAMALPYEDNTFDASMSAFGMRNVPDVKQMLLEMKRVVKPGGRVVTLELGKPRMIGFKQLYYLYFEQILPHLGKLSSKDSAYRWLPESLKRYPHQSEIEKLYKDLGYENVTCYELTGGVVAVHYAEVPLP